MCINTSKGCIVNKSVIFWQDYLYRPFWHFIFLIYLKTFITQIYLIFILKWTTTLNKQLLVLLLPLINLYLRIWILIWDHLCLRDKVVTLHWAMMMLCMLKVILGAKTLVLLGNWARTLFLITMIMTRSWAIVNWIYNSRLMNALLWGRNIKHVCWRKSNFSGLSCLKLPLFRFNTLWKVILLLKQVFCNVN